MIGLAEKCTIHVPSMGFVRLASTYRQVRLRCTFPSAKGKRFIGCTRPALQVDRGKIPSLAAGHVQQVAGSRCTVRMYWHVLAVYADSDVIDRR